MKLNAALEAALHPISEVAVVDCFAHTSGLLLLPDLMEAYIDVRIAQLVESYRHADH